MFRQRQSVLFFVLATGGTDRRTVSSTTSGTAERNASRLCAGRERRVHSGYTVQSDSERFSSARDVRCGGSASPVL